MSHHVLGLTTSWFCGRLLEYLSETELPANDIMLILSTFTKAFKHVMDENAKERALQVKMAERWKKKAAAGQAKKKKAAAAPRESLAGGNATAAS